MRIVFVGTGEIGVPILLSLLHHSEHQLVGIATQPDKPVGREQRIQAPPIKVAAADSGVPIYQPARIKGEGAVAELRALAPDLIVVMAYGQILPRAVLEIPRVACLNLHASLLPRHRGAAPIQASIGAGDRETGITVMYMDEGLDTGDILLARTLAIAPDETGGSLHDRLAGIAPAALEEAMHLLGNGVAPRVPQDNLRATFAPKLEREHGRIDWAQSAEAIERKIRAFNPWPGSYTTIRNPAGSERKLKIFSTAIVGTTSNEPRSLALTETGIVVATAGGALSLGEVQLEGKRRMSAAEFARGQTWLAHSTVA